MSDDLTALLDELDAAREKATPGEWYERPGHLGPAVFSNAPGLPGVGHTYMPDDAALIVAAVNNLPKLTAALRAVVKRHVATEDPAFCDDCMAAWPCRTVRDIAAALAPEQAEPVIRPLSVDPTPGEAGK